MLPRCRWRAPRRRWAAPLRVVAAAAVLAPGVPAPALADPRDQPGGASGVLDSAALDALQQRATEVQAGLQQRQAEIAQA